VTLFPLMARLAKDNRRGLRVVYRWSVARAAAVAVPAVLIVVGAAPWILTWWQGADYLPAVPALRWLLVATLCSCLAVVAGNVLIVIEQARSLLVIWTVAAPVNVLLNWFWIADYGATGAAAASCVTGAVVLILSLAVVERHLAVGPNVSR